MSLTELDRLKNLIADTGDLKDWIVSLKTQIHSIVSSSPHAVIDDEAFIKRYISRKLLKELRAILFPKTPQN